MNWKELPENENLLNIIESFIKDFWNETADMPVRQLPNQALIKKYQEYDIPTNPRDVDTIVRELKEEVYPYRLRFDHPRMFGFIPSPHTKLSWLGDIMTTAYNVHASNTINNPTSAMIEARLIDWMGSMIGFPKETRSGLFVSGGSMSNFTAVVAARDAILTDDTRHLGVVYLTDQTHHSVEKALAIIGYSKKQLRFIAFDDQFRMVPHALELQIQKDRNDGFIPCTILATAGTTNTGSVDDLGALAAIRDRHGMWLHVDGAYGASYLLSPSQAWRMKDIDKADSVTWDAHKALFQTFSCAMLIVKEQKHLLDSFSASPVYLQDLEQGLVNYASMGLELTRPARALKLWLSLQVLGTAEIGRRLDHGQALVEYVAHLIEEKPQWEIISDPSCAIINFRYIKEGATAAQLDDLNHSISNSIVESGFAAVYTTILHNKTVLRICAFNPLTTFEDMEATVHHIETYAQEFEL